ncbi:MAG: GNAT family N-acetyltransferase [Parvularculaceae bacterium]
MIRAATADDLPGVLGVAEATEMFLGDELDGFTSALRASFGSDGGDGDATLLVADDAATVVGAAYFAPEAMAQGVMNLLFLGVAPAARRRGVGEALLGAFEAAARRRGARLAIIETASDETFAPAWALYEKAGYAREARVRDYYDDGLHKLIFRKRP